MRKAIASQISYFSCQKGGRIDIQIIQAIALDTKNRTSWEVRYLYLEPYHL